MRIKTKILWTLLGMSSLVAVVGALAVNRQSAAATIAAIKEAEGVARVLSFLISDQSELPKSLQETITKLYQTQGRDVVLMDAQRQILADADSKAVGQTYKWDRGGEIDLTLKDRKARTFVETGQDHPAGMMEIVVPIEGKEGKVIGAVVLEYTPLHNELMQLTRTTTDQLVLVAAGCLTIALLIAFFARRSIVGPLQQLTNAATGFASGRTDAPMPRARKDEIGELAAAFDSMTEKRQEAEAALRRARDELEMRVVDRTRELSDANGTLQTQARVIESMTEAVTVADEDGCIVSANPACADMFGYERGELIGQHASVLRDLEATEGRRVVTEMLASMQNESSWSGEVNRRRKNGTSFIAQAQISAFEIAGKRHFFSVQSDVTERRQAEAERQVISDIVQGITTTTNLDELLELCWRSISQLLYAENCFVGLHDAKTDLIHFEFWVDKFDSVPPPQPISNGFTRSSHVLRTGQPLLLTTELKAQLFDQGKVAKSGTDSASWLGVPLRTPTRTIGVLAVQHYEKEGVYNQHDLEFLSLVGDQIALVIERKQAEETLRESEEKFRQLADNITDAFWIASHDLGIMHYVSAGYELIWGRSTESLYADPHQWMNTILPQDREHVMAVFGTLMKDEAQVSAEYRIARPDGTIRWVHDRGFQIRDAAGKLVRLTGIASDITERKQSEKALQKSEARTSAIVQSSLDCIVSIDHEGKIFEFNPAAEKVFGHSRAEVLGKEMAAVIVPSSLREGHREGMARYLATGAARVLGKRIEMAAIRSDGSEFPIELAITRMGDEEPPQFTASIRDITERKLGEVALEEANRQLLETSRQAGMAEVATSVLHNVGNVLNSVNISCSVISDRVRKSPISSVAKTAELLQEHTHDLAAFFNTDPVGRKLPNFLGKLSTQLSDEQTAVVAELQLLTQNIEHIKDIVSVQQSHANNVGGVRETLPCDGLMEDALRINEGSLKRHHIEVLREYSDAPPISLEKHKVLQILVNLVRNAKQALTASDRPDKRLTVQIGRNNGDVSVSVNDNGIGIAPENLTRIFAHGFTTRKDGHGFGLHSGVLAAQEMGGGLTVHSNGLGTGATFTLKLPVAGIGNT